MEKRTKLTIQDHRILIRLIRGKTPTEVAEEFKITPFAVQTRIIRMKRIMELPTTYALIAWEVVNFMEMDSICEGLGEGCEQTSRLQ